MKWHYHIQFLDNRTKPVFDSIKAKITLTKQEEAALEQAFAAEKRNEFIIAVLNETEQPVGLVFVKADQPREKVWTVGCFALIADVQKQGLARLLNQTIAEWAADSGADKLEVEVAKNSAAAEFLTHLGYQPQSDGQTARYYLTI